LQCWQLLSRLLSSCSSSCEGGARHAASPIGTDCDPHLQIATQRDLNSRTTVSLTPAPSAASQPSSIASGEIMMTVVEEEGRTAVSDAGTVEHSSESRKSALASHIRACASRLIAIDRWHHNQWSSLPNNHEAYCTWWVHSHKTRARGAPARYGVLSVWPHPDTVAREIYSPCCLHTRALVPESNSNSMPARSRTLQSLAVSVILNHVSHDTASVRGQPARGSSR
jgi:hypothetical protein